MPEKLTAIHKPRITSVDVPAKYALVAFQLQLRSVMRFPIRCRDPITLNYVPSVDGQVGTSAIWLRLSQ